MRDENGLPYILSSCGEPGCPGCGGVRRYFAIEKSHPEPELPPVLEALAAFKYIMEVERRAQAVYERRAKAARLIRAIQESQFLASDFGLEEETQGSSGVITADDYVFDDDEDETPVPFEWIPFKQSAQNQTDTKEEGEEDPFAPFNPGEQLKRLEDEGEESEGEEGVQCKPCAEPPPKMPSIEDAPPEIPRQLSLGMSEFRVTRTTTTSKVTAKLEPPDMKAERSLGMSEFRYKKVTKRTTTVTQSPPLSNKGSPTFTTTQVETSSRRTTVHTATFVIPDMTKGISTASAASFEDID